MKFLTQTVVIICLTALAPLAAIGQQYMIGYAGFAGFQASMWAVKDLGLLKKHGLEGETVLVPGTSRQIQALVGDSIQFAHVDAAGHIRAVMRGADIVMVAASLNKFPFSLVTRKEIRKPTDLVGKKIGIVGFGGANDLAVTLLLKEWKIPRDNGFAGGRRGESTGRVVNGSARCHGAFAPGTRRGAANGDQRNGQFGRVQIGGLSDVPRLLCAVLSWDRIAPR